MGPMGLMRPMGFSYEGNHFGQLCIIVFKKLAGSHRLRNSPSETDGGYSKNILDSF